MLFEPYVRFHIWVTEFFPPLGLWSVDFFLVAPFPDHCLLVHFYNIYSAFHFFCYD